MDNQANDILHQDNTAPDADQKSVKKNKRHHSIVWFVLHKIFLIIYAILLCINLPMSAGGVPIWFDPKPDWFDPYDSYIFDRFETGYFENVLFRKRIIYDLQIIVFALVMISWLKRIIDQYREVSDIEREKNFFEDKKNLIDIALNIYLIVFLVLPAYPVIFSFQSAQKSDCTLSSKIELAELMSHDDKEGFPIETESLIVERSDAAVREEALNFSKSLASPLEFKLPLPFGKEFSIFWDWDNGIWENKWVNVYYGEYRPAKYMLYALDCGEMTFPLSETDSQKVKYGLENYSNEYKYLKAQYYPSSKTLCSVSLQKTADQKEPDIVIAGDHY